MALPTKVPGWTEGDVLCGAKLTATNIINCSDCDTVKSVALGSMETFAALCINDCIADKLPRRDADGIQFATHLKSVPCAKRRRLQINALVLHISINHKGLIDRFILNSIGGMHS